MRRELNELERKAELVSEVFGREQEFAADFHAKLDVSWIYHDCAIEGTVLSFHELNSCVDEAIITDMTLVPQYDEVRNLNAAISFARNAAGKKKPGFGVEYLKQLHHILSEESQPRSVKAPPKPPPGQYRKDNPMHRQYFHEICSPEKINYQMRKLFQWLETDEFLLLHPVAQAIMLHYRVLKVFPWPKHSGYVARLLMNTMLLHHGYLPVVLHAVDRHRYYESVKQSFESLAAVCFESLNRMFDTSLQALDQIA